MLGDGRDPAGDVRHVEGAGDPVDQADPDQEKQRRRQVDRDIAEPGPDAVLA
ncbi:hypothetical protein D3C73_1644750 [compost metagenome]